jgi:EAL domain-containing protein (putative c-di-GMP-specific phosphodiesterase class I)
MNIDSNKLVMLDAALRKAIENKEFVLHYQPKLDLKEGHVLGVEALLRWQSPVLGLVKPNRFIPLAEETGSILQLGEWVFHEICRTNKSWRSQGLKKPLSIAVNLSLTQFRHQDIVSQIESILKKNDMDPQWLELEIASSTLMSDLAISIPILHALSDTGVKIVIDEFGLGSTSLDFLKNLPISYLKIDQSFVKGTPSNEHDTDIAKAIIELAHGLKIKVIATGIETSEQFQFFSSNNCQIGQGYLFSKPVTEDDFISNYFNSPNQPFQTSGQ